MNRIDRSAIFLRPKDPFVTWVNATGDGGDPITVQHISSDNPLYLVEPIESVEDLDLILDELYPEIFEDQLDGWCTDKNLWPEERDRLMFHSWFEVVVCSEVSDLG